MENMFRIKSLLLLCLSLFILKHNDTQAQVATDSAHVFTLGEVIVTAQRNKSDVNMVSAATNNAYNKMDVSHSLNLLPGISLSAVGPRNESGVYVHGFDLRQVPLYLDGIPVYVPYDGYVDLGRFTTFDLAEIQVSRGYSSVLYGPNAIGGAINLITKKPVKRMETNAEAGYYSGGYLLSADVGSKMKNTYWQVSASKLKRNFYPLSGNFDSAKAENGGRRDNSYSDDAKVSAKFGFKPGTGQEYAIGYAYQHGTKGTPVYTGRDTLNSLFKNPRYWQWPRWDKQSIYLITNNFMDSNNSIKGRLYYDQFKNKLYSYNDNTYTTISRPYAFKSIYNDYSFGGSLEYGNTSVKNNRLSVAVHFKQDVHREHNEGEPVRVLSDNNSTIATEDVYHLTPRLLATAGFSYMTRHSITAEGYNSTTKMVFNFADNDNDAFNLAGGLRYNFPGSSSLNMSVARKTRFATIKDRYSFRLGTAIPNPDLNAESAVNYNLDYTGNIYKQISVEASLFYSDIQNTIQNVNNVGFDSVTHRYLSQLQNTGKAEFYGADAAITYRPFTQLSVTGNYSYIIRKNLSNKNLKFTDVPAHKVMVYGQYYTSPGICLTGSAEYNSNRYSTSYGTIAQKFYVCNFKAGYKINKYISAEGGVNNVFDKNYSLVEGYPEAGRSYLANIIFSCGR